MAKSITLSASKAPLRQRLWADWQRVRKYPTFVQALLGMYAAYYLALTVFYGIHLARYGFFGRETALEVNLFYDLLVLVSPITAILLFLRPSVGMLTALAIIFFSLYFSSYPEYTINGRPTHNWFHFLEGIFGVFMMSSMPIVWVGKMMYESTEGQRAK